MRILFLLRFDAADKPGGDVIQINKYASFVREAGGEALFTSSLAPNASRVDLVHAFNIDRPETYFQVMSVSERFPKVPILLTPIHHSNLQRKQYEAQGRRGALRIVNTFIASYQLREALKFLARGLASPALFSAALRFLTVREPQMKIGAKASVTLFLSEAERKWCAEDYQIRCAREEIFPNGLEATGSVHGVAVRDIDVIMTGRIESRKNQLSVLKALSGSNLKVCLLGAVNKRHRAYLQEFRRVLVANPSFEYLGPRPHSETLSFLTRAKVYISASWLEVMSLSDLEAFAAGCRVVASVHGSTREVLGDEACYVNPGSIEEIRTVVFEQLAKDVPLETSARYGLIEKYQWNRLGETLLRLYENELGNCLEPVDGGGRKH